MHGGWDDGEPGRITSARDMHDGLVIAEFAMHIDGLFRSPNVWLEPRLAAESGLGHDRRRPRPQMAKSLLAEL